MKKVIYQLETLSCPSCSDRIGAVLQQTPGVVESEVLFNSSRVKLTYDETVTDSKTIRTKIRSIGYLVLSER